MKIPRTMLVFLGLACAALVLTACGRATPEITAPASSALPPADTLTPVPSATFPPPPTATRTPTRTPRPTATDRPRPSPTPAGFYNHARAGFSLTFPHAVTVLEQDEASVFLRDPQETLLIGVMSGAANPEITFEYMEEMIIGTSNVVRQADLSEISLGAAGYPAQAKQYTFRAQDGSLTDSLLIFYQDERRYYVLVLFGEEGFPTGQAAYLEKLYRSVTFYPPSPFELPRDQTLTLLGGDPSPEDLDPHQTTGGILSYAGLVFSGLVRLDQNLNVVPDLAEDWSISAGGTVYTFTLRADLSFADGSFLTAEDVVYSWNRAADPKTDSPTYDTYLGDIAGVAARHAGEADSISGLKIISSRVLQVTLDAPKPYFLLKLTYPVAFVIDRTDVGKGGEDWMFDPNASGPYAIDDYVEMEKLIFKLNKRYHSPPAVTYLGYLLNPQGSPVSRYEDGTLDLLPVSGETALRVRRIEDPLHADLHSVASLCTSFIALNNTLPPFDDPKVREAFLLAFDRDTYMQRIDRGLDLPALSLLPPAMPGYLPENAVPAYDPQAAKAALAASRYAGNLPEVVLETAGFGTEDDPVISALAEMWRQTLGVDIQVVFLDPINYTEAAREYPAHLSASGWCADYPDPQNFFDPLVRTGGEFNDAGYTNPELDALLAQANVEADPQRRLALYQQAEKLLLADFALLPLTHNIRETLVNPRILGYVHSPLLDLNLHDLVIGPEAP